MSYFKSVVHILSDIYNSLCSHSIFQEITRVARQPHDPCPTQASIRYFLRKVPVSSEGLNYKILHHKKKGCVLHVLSPADN